MDENFIVEIIHWKYVNGYKIGVVHNKREPNLFVTIFQMVKTSSSFTIVHRGIID